jgi:hypothetical protein
MIFWAQSSRAADGGKREIETLCSIQDGEFWG